MTKSYALLIGKKFGDREILSISKKRVNGRSKVFANCKCKCGRTSDVRLSALLNDDCLYCRYCSSANITKPNVSNKTGIRHVSFDASRQQYAVEIMRKGVRKRGRTKTLAEAKVLKEQFLSEFETEGLV